MANFIDVGDVLAMRVVTFQANQLGLNDVHWFVTAEVGAPTLENMVASIDATCALQYIQNLPSTAIYRGIGIRRLVPTKSVEITSVANAGPGTAVGKPVPLQISGLISKYGQFPGKANRGRIYIPFVPDSAVSAAGEPTAAYLAPITGIGAIGAFLFQPQAFTAGANTLNLQPVIFHKGSPFRVVLPANAVRGDSYTIQTLGTTDFTLMGAASNTVGLSFVATRRGTGTGTMTQAAIAQSWSFVDRFAVRPKFAAQHRRGDFGRLNSLPF